MRLHEFVSQYLLHFDIYLGTVMFNALSLLEPILFYLIAWCWETEYRLSNIFTVPQCSSWQAQLSSCLSFVWSVTLQIASQAPAHLLWSRSRRCRRGWWWCRARRRPATRAPSPSPPPPSCSPSNIFDSIKNIFVCMFINMLRCWCNAAQEGVHDSLPSVLWLRSSVSHKHHACRYLDISV